MGKFKGKMSSSQILFMAFFSATVNTILNEYIVWDHRILAVIFAGFITVVGGILALIIFKSNS